MEPVRVAQREHMDISTERDGMDTCRHMCRHMCHIEYVAHQSIVKMGAKEWTHVQTHVQTHVRTHEFV